MKTFNENSEKITKKDLVRVFFRSFQMEFSWNYERQMNLAYVYSLIPALKKIHSDEEELKKALKRHLEFFNMTPHIVTLMLGINVAMEEENSKDEKFSQDSINSIKTALMGPLSGLGDSFFWGTLRLIATGIGTSLALKGSILGPILFLLIFNIPHIILRYFFMFFGYKLGIESIKSLEKNGQIYKITNIASILGVIVIGAMSASLVDINILLTMGSNNEFVLQNILNDIMPKLPQLISVGFIYWLLNKKINPITIIFGIAVFSIIMSYFGVL